jgi:ubiquinone/menaquinone biosynthesis C-methylase UbiE
MLYHNLMPLSRFDFTKTGNYLYDYHLGELKLALDPTDPRHILPSVHPTEKVLDIGCGAGQTLIATCDGRRSYGMDIEMEALQIGQKLTQDVAFTRASAESLPYRSGSFDLVVSRVTLFYTDLPTSFAEIYRVLRPGGRIWITLNDLRRPLRLARRVNTWKAWIWFLYLVMNGLLFHFTGKLVRFPGRGMESFQTDRGVRRALKKIGFEQIEINPRHHFLITAVRPPER